MSSHDDETRLAPEKAPSSPAGGDSKSATSASGWLSSSGAIDHGRFPPGTLLGGRYRVVERRGRGGMGEVYRADDLKLGQPVALKFLPPEVDRDPARLMQLHTEVRMARQVSHPNVCRVYDIDEVEGHTLISMEYVDGEELASLLRRIGRFPAERALELSRQICAGLAAAHERGVVHRDLKPANVMLDATGKVRITDFGLAGAAGESIRAGTPAYMAPEQLAGGEVTPRSDIYALGLVLYELFTGQRALEGENLAELIRRREEAGFTPPSAIVRDLDPAVDRAILRCLEREPRNRPASALAVAAALPGGDPLAAALAAGETPSPEMVAAAGEAECLSRPAGTLLAATVVLGLVAIAFAADRVLLVNRIPPPKSPDVLEERAREIIATAGYADVAADTARGVMVHDEYVSWIERTQTAASRWDVLGTGDAPVLRFWYRTSPRPLNPISPTWMPQLNDPPLAVSGMRTVVVDDRGRLLEFVTMPPQLDPSEAAATRVDWTPLFAAANLRLGEFSEAAPQWTPRIYAEQRIAWEGPMPSHPDIRLRVEAASYRGRPVAFQVIGPWTNPAHMPQAPTSAVRRAVSVAATLFLIALLAGAIALARYSVKSGRADVRGARRVTFFLIIFWVAAWAFGSRHTFAVDQELNRFFMFLGLAVLNTALTWLFYLGLEPFVRRLCPEILISWTRLLRGNIGDPLVGRDLLVGIATGVFITLLATIDSILPALSGAPAPAPEAATVQYLLGGRYVVSAALRLVPNALQNAMLGTFLYVMLLAVVRHRLMAAALAVGLFLAVLGGDDDVENVWRTVLVAALLSIPVLFVFLRYGLLAGATVIYTNQLLKLLPLTADLTRPYAGIGWAAILIVSAITCYTFYLSRAGEGMFRRFLPA